MPAPFIFVATNKIRDGKLPAERQRVPGWVDYLATNEPRLIAFHEYVNDDGTEVEYVQIHPDAEAFEYHLQVVARSGRPYTETLEGTISIRIYGTPTPAILDMLRTAGADVPVTILSEHLGGITRQ
jgi:hypothetical protein